MKRNHFFIAVISLSFLSFANCNAKSTQCTVSVSGKGVVVAKPDMVQMNIDYSHVAPTTREAKAEVDSKIQQIIDLLKAGNISDNNIQTISINYDEAREYQDGHIVVKGQKVEQIISVIINDIISDSNKFPLLLDKIAAIDKVNIRSIKFDIKNKGELFEQCRRSAYQDALDKASQYAVLCGKKVAGALTISEENALNLSDITVNSYGAMRKSARVGSTSNFDVPTANVPTGEQEITLKINVTFLLD